MCWNCGIGSGLGCWSWCVWSVIYMNNFLYMYLCCLFFVIFFVVAFVYGLVFWFTYIH